MHVERGETVLRRWTSNRGCPNAGEAVARNPKSIGSQTELPIQSLHLQTHWEEFDKQARRAKSMLELNVEKVEVTWSSFLMVG
jgi:hypothetical protein